MAILLAILQIIPTVLELILTAERLYGEAQKGAVKKQTVMQAVELGVTTARQAGAPLSEDEAKTMIDGLGKIVDGTVATFNQFGWPTGAPAPGNA
jgi:hypothetical protein